MFASILLMLIYIICSALGLVLLKAGLNNGTIISLNADFLGIKFHILFICGTLLYIFSFLLNMFVINKFNLSYAYPITAGLIYITILLLSVLILKEQISARQMIGMVTILIGIIIMNISK